MKRRLNLGLGAVLLAAWVAATALAVWLRLPGVAVKAILGCCAAIWAVHVAGVLLANRRL